MAIEISDRQKRTSIDRKSTRRLVERVLSDHARRDSDVSIVFADDEFVRALNLGYRGKDRPTDVLAFPMPGEGATQGEALDDHPETILGDVVISTDRAAAQARRFRRTEGREILKLVAHGVLHLLGHDHATRGERSAMSSLENRYVRGALARAPEAPTSAGNRRKARPGGRGRS